MFHQEFTNEVSSFHNMEDFDFCDFSSDLFDGHNYANMQGQFKVESYGYKAGDSDGSSKTRKAVAKKSNRTHTTGSKTITAKLRSSSPYSDSEVTTLSVIGGSQLAPSRSSRDFKLFVFPSFDRCDALLYFPSTMARHLNSGDFPALTKLMGSHCHKNCDFTLPVYSKTPSLFNSAKFLELFQLMNELHPDSMMCCHTTKVVENEIQARMYFKFTDSQALYTAMSRTVTDPVFAGILIRERAEKFKEQLQVINRPEHEQRQFNELLESGADMTVYGQVDLGLQFDDVSKKITGLKFFAKFTSLTPANKPKYLSYMRS